MDFLPRVGIDIIAICLGKNDKENSLCLCLCFLIKWGAYIKKYLKIHVTSVPAICQMVQPQTVLLF